MAKILITNAVVRKPGFLYYIDGQGNICESKMARKGKTTAKKPVAKKPVKAPAKKPVKKAPAKKK